jgi:1,2-diacylglycerol 3-beta-glucosyltransferase
VQLNLFIGLSVALFTLMAAAGASISLFAAAYHVLLAGVAAWRHAPPLPAAAKAKRFGILIPAHNEEACIAQAIASCHAQDYAPESIEVVVIADNCTDGTAHQARTAGAICLERSNDRQRGKGSALAWAFPQICDRGYDAVVILDADCTLDRNALSALCEGLLAGHHAIQLRNVPSNADECSVSYLLAVANRLENDFFYKPKDLLGLAVFLRGTGMMLSSEILAACPWQAFSRAEDAEYTLRLFDRGYRVRFETRAAVRSAAPIQPRQLATQRRRWVGGQLEVALSNCWSLVRGAIRHRSLRLLDAAWTSFIVLRIVVVSLLVSALVLAVVNAWLVNDLASRLILSAALMSAALFTAYASIGVISFGLTAARLKLLTGAVTESMRYLALSLRACLNRDKAWNRTER